LFSSSTSQAEKETKKGLKKFVLVLQKYQSTSQKKYEKSIERVKVKRI
jgi:hypothetical protein